MNRYPTTGIALGLIFTGFFGAIWGLNALPFLAQPIQRPGLLLVCGVTLVFWTVGTRALFRARSLVMPVTGLAPARNRAVWSGFGLVFTAEMALIFLARFLLVRSGTDELILPVIALIVGLHFLPLARIFEFWLFSITGLSLCGIALLALAAGLSAPSPIPDGWLLFVAAGAALVLWVTGLRMALLLAAKQ